MNEDELYTFSLILCDNEIDRDMEQFPTEELEKIALLFTGKTGIFDHNPKAENQCARIYRCAVERDSLKRTSVGEEYACVRADAYIPKNDNTNRLISDIDSGIKKEVSIGCAARATVCSICGHDINGPECVHKKGQIYDDALCYGKIEDIYDAYEWSFVAVPAQKNAGVIKSYNMEVDLLDSLSKKLELQGGLYLSDKERLELLGYINGLKKLSADGELYRKQLANDILKLNAFSQNGVAPGVLSSVIERMTVDELKAFKAAFEKNEAEAQLAPSKNEQRNKICDEYII